MSEFLSALLGGVFALFAVVLTGATEAARRHADERQRIADSLNALIAELDAFDATVVSQMHPLVGELRSRRVRYIPLTGEYWSVYKANASVLGSVPRDTSRAIICAYNVCFTLVSSVESLNDYLSREPRSTSGSASGRLLARFDKFRVDREVFESVLAIVDQSQAGITEAKRAVQGFLAQESQKPIRSWPQYIEEYLKGLWK